MVQFPGLGDQLPAATLSASDGTPLDLAQFAGRKLVLFFYPKDDTPGCTTESIDFSALAGEFDKAGTALIPSSAEIGRAHV